MCGIVRVRDGQRYTFAECQTKLKGYVCTSIAGKGFHATHLEMGIRPFRWIPKNRNQKYRGQEVLQPYRRKVESRVHLIRKCDN